jgi:predicted transcriptional regulator
MKRQKNYRQLRGKSTARNRLNEIKSRAVASDINFSDAPVLGENIELFDEKTVTAAIGKPIEDRFEDTPIPEFQFDWDREFFGTASSGSNDFTETIPFELQAVDEVQATTEDAGIMIETSPEIQEEVTAVINAESVEPTPAATVETRPEQSSAATVKAEPARFVSVKRQMAFAAREAEKMRNPEEKSDKKGETPSLNVRRAPSFRSFVVSTIQRLMDEQRFLASEPESSRFLARELGIGKKEEPEVSDTSAQEKSQGGFTRWNNPLIAASSNGLAHYAGAKGQKSNSSLPEEKQPVTRSSSAGAKLKPAPGSYELNAARITLMEARINARAISSNMRMKW